MARPSDPEARSKLLAAAEAVFVEQGVAGSRVEDITRRAGLSKGAFYLHFESKDEALNAVVTSTLERLARAVEEACAVELSAPEQLFEHWLELDVRLYEFIWANRLVLRLLLAGSATAAFTDIVDEFGDRACAKTRAMLEAGVRRGVFRADLDLNVAAEFLAGAYDRLARRLVKQTRKPDLRALLLQMQRLALAGLGSASLLEAYERHQANETYLAGAAPAPPPSSPPTRQRRMTKRRAS